MRFDPAGNPPARLSHGGRRASGQQIAHRSSHPDRRTGFPASLIALFLAWRRRRTLKQLTPAQLADAGIPAKLAGGGQVEDANAAIIANLETLK